MKSCTLISKSFRSMLVILVVCLLGGCSAKIHCWSEESFRSNDFNEEKLEKEGSALFEQMASTAVDGLLKTFIP